MCQIQCSWDAGQKFSLDWMIELFRSRGQIFEVKKLTRLGRFWHLDWKIHRSWTAMTISGVISILIVPENIWYWKVCFVRPKFDKKRIQAEPSFFLVSLASRSNFFLAPKVGIPISFNSSSVSVANVGRSISWRTKISAYLSNLIRGTNHDKTNVKDQNLGT